MTPTSRWPPKSVTLEWEGIRLYKGSRIQKQRGGKDQTQGQDDVKETGEKSGSFSFLSFRVQLADGLHSNHNNFHLNHLPFGNVNFPMNTKPIPS
jgi:hypothetical protein